MAIFGWIVLLMITLYFIIMTTIGVFASLGFSGKIEKTLYVFAFVSAYFAYITYRTMPFAIVLR